MFGAHSTSQPDAACQLHGRGDKKFLFAKMNLVINIDISRHQRFEYDVQAGYCIQNSIQTNLLQAHSFRFVRDGCLMWGRGGWRCGSGIPKSGLINVLLKLKKIITLNV